jgi:cytochrome c oxidase subunit II
VRWRAGATLLVAGCRGQQSALDPAGPFAARLHDLLIVMTVGGAAIWAVVIGFLVLALILPRRPDPEEGHGEPERRHLVPIAIGAGLTVTLMLALLVVSVQASRAITVAPADALPIQVVARQWWWDVTYTGTGLRTANELRIPVGRPVVVTLETRDVIHSFWVPSLHGKMDAIPGRRNSLVLQADVPGVYRGQCAEFCGLQHARMAFHVIALPAADFERWRDAQLAPARPPADELARRGQEVFLTSSCVLCHAIRGTAAMAHAGPDLTHLASRGSLAAGTIPNRRGHLGGWILDPQHVKPGTFMPPSQLSGPELQALLRYLETLE